jgi:predicted class III extradiol MEMO1 family dioxygenase
MAKELKLKKGKNKGDKEDKKAKKGEKKQRKVAVKTALGDVSADPVRSYSLEKAMNGYTVKGFMEDDTPFHFVEHSLRRVNIRIKKMGEGE